MALLSVIRRWHLREDIPIREIARRTGLSRNTVRKYLASQVVEPAYPARWSPSKLGDYADTLTNWLFRESRRYRKQRRTVKQLHRDLIVLGFTGSYDRVTAFSRQWRRAQHGKGSEPFFPGYGRTLRKRALTPFSQFVDGLGIGSDRPDLVVRFGRGREMPRSLRRPVEAVLA